MLSGLMVTAPAAQAATTCTDHAYSPGYGWYQYCQVDRIRVGARVTGAISWTYQSPGSRNEDAGSGDLILDLKDTADDGKCAVLRVIIPEWDTNYKYEACGVGTTTRVVRNINGGEYNYWYGTYTVKFCTGVMWDNCTWVWSMDIQDPGPS